MRIKHRYILNNGEKDILAFLDKMKIKYDKNEIITVFEIYEDDRDYMAIKAFMTSKGNESIGREAVYTIEEINEAQWLAVRSSWVSLYPHPREDMKYRFTTYDATDYCEGSRPKYYCNKGSIQKEDFAFEKKPNWGPRNFLMINWVADELFISEKAVDILKASNLKGFKIMDVMTKSRNIMDGVKQLFVESYLDKGLCPETIRETLVCPKCGFEKYIPVAGPFSYRKEAFEAVDKDIVKTEEKFGGVMCFSYIIVTQRFRELLANSKLDRGLVYEPVKLV